MHNTTKHNDVQKTQINPPFSFKSLFLIQTNKNRTVRLSPHNAHVPHNADTLTTALTIQSQIQSLQTNTTNLNFSPKHSLTDTITINLLTLNGTLNHNITPLANT
jgi:hypothetical protein